MLLKILLYVSLFSTSSLIFGQSYKISKIIETNLFELDNGQKVKLYGLYIPARQDTNATLSKLAEEIYQWEINNLLDWNTSVEILGRSEDGADLVTIYKHFPLFIKRNIANDLLSNGYATLINDMNKNYQTELSEYQGEAQKNKLGIWKESLATLINIDTTIFNTEEQSVVFKSRPYLPLLSLSIAAFALSWDSFAAISPIQKVIDAEEEKKKLAEKNHTAYDDGLLSDLKADKTRKIIVGVTCLAAGIIITLYSVKSVEIKTDLQSISLSYRF